MNLIQTYHADLLNGEGLREVLFFSGCTHHCPGCFSPETWTPNHPGAHEWGESDWKELSENLGKPYISGVTLTGGDPLSHWNREDISRLCVKLKTEFPEKTIWLYTGFTWESLIGEKILDYIDVLCEGPFMQSQASPSKPWVGSDNQRVIDVKKSLAESKVILFGS